MLLLPRSRNNGARGTNSFILGKIARLLTEAPIKDQFSNFSPGVTQIICTTSEIQGGISQTSDVSSGNPWLSKG